MGNNEISANIPTDNDDYVRAHACASLHSGNGCSMSSLLLCVACFSLRALLFVFSFHFIPFINCNSIVLP